MVQAAQPTDNPISQQSLKLPPKLSDPKPELEYLGLQISKKLTKSVGRTLSSVFKRFDALSPTVDELKHPFINEPEKKAPPLPTLSTPQPNVNLKAIQAKPPEPLPKAQSVKQATPPPPPPPSTPASKPIQPLKPTISVIPKVELEELVEKQPEPPKHLPGTKPPLSSDNLVVLPPVSEQDDQTAEDLTPVFLEPAPGATPPARPNRRTPLNSGLLPSVKKKSKPPSVSLGKLAAYFLLGLVFNILAIAPVTLWLIFKNKLGTKSKFGAFLAGFGVAIVIGVALQAVLTPIFTQFLANTFPPLAYVPPYLQQVYPEAEFGAHVLYTKDFTDDQVQDRAVLTVSISSPNTFPADDIKSVGMLACDITTNRGDQFDEVVVSQINKMSVLFLTLDFTQSYSQTCEEWFQKPAPAPFSI